MLLEGEGEEAYWQMRRTQKRRRKALMKTEAETGKQEHSLLRRTSEEVRSEIWVHPLEEGA